MRSLDRIDWLILQSLRENCRVSYQRLAKRCGLSPPAIRNRVLNLESSGIISEYVVLYSLAMVSAFAILIEVYTDGSEIVKEFINSVGMNPMIGEVCWSGQDKYILYGYCRGIENAANLAEYIRSYESVVSAELFPLLCPRGHSISLTRNQQRIYQAIAEDPRSSYQVIADRIGLSTKTVRRAISLVNGNILHFTVNWNPSAGDNIGFFVKLSLKEPSRMNELCEELLALPIPVWETYRCATDPILFILFSSTTMTDFNEVLIETQSIMETMTLSSTMCASWHSFANLRMIGSNNIEV